jgi:hypothetical protein
MFAAGVVLASVVVLASTQATQPLPAPSGLIVGRVVDATSGRPVAGAIVSLEGVRTQAGPPRAMTNASGHFVFRRLSKGSYSLTTNKSGYVDGAYGRRTPGGASASLALEDGQRVGDVTIRIWRVASIGGAVTDEAGEPLAGVQVRAYQRRYVSGVRRLVQNGSAFTDDRGVYRFGSLAPGEYLVAFVAREVSMPPSIAELGRNPNPGDPKTAELLRDRFAFGGIASAPGSPNTIEVDGFLRQLDPSAPVPPASSAGSPLFIYPTQFFPGAPSASRATVLDIGSGQQRDNVDFALRPVRAMRISGTVVGLDGPAAGMALRLIPTADGAITDLEAAGALSGPDGAFVFFGVQPGEYTIKTFRVPQSSARQPTNVTQMQVGSSMIMSSSSAGGPPSPIPDDPTVFADVAIGVGNQDVSGVVVPLQRGGRVTGRVEFDGVKERPDPQALARIPVTFERADGLALGGSFQAIPSGRVDETGAFKTYGVPAGAYMIRVPVAPPGWSLKGVMSEGRDISDSPLTMRTADVANVTIVFTDRPSKLAGIARTSDGNPDPEALVVVFPADTATWNNFGLSPRRMRSARAAKTGAYAFDALPAGDYFVASIREESYGQWQTPEVLEELARTAVQVKLGDGETKTQDVKTAGGGR